jgi:dTMP kinase
LDAGDPVPSVRAELLLYLADRAQHVDEVIRPSLQSGHVVLSDRFSASTIAYQGFGRDLDGEAIERFDAWARDGVSADLTILLDCPVEIGLARARGDDRFHREAIRFHQRVRQGFLILADADPDHWVIVDTTRPKAAVAEEIRLAVEKRLPQPDRR